MDGQHLTTP